MCVREREDHVVDSTVGEGRQLDMKGKLSLPPSTSTSAMSTRPAEKEDVVMTIWLRVVTPVTHSRSTHTWAGDAEHREL